MRLWGPHCLACFDQAEPVVRYKPGLAFVKFDGCSMRLCRDCRGLAEKRPGVVRDGIAEADFIRSAR